MLNDPDGVPLHQFISGLKSWRGKHFVYVVSGHEDRDIKYKLGVSTPLHCKRPRLAEYAQTWKDARIHYYEVFPRVRLGAGAYKAKRMETQLIRAVEQYKKQGREYFTCTPCQLRSALSKAHKDLANEVDKKLTPARRSARVVQRDETIARKMIRLVKDEAHCTRSGLVRIKNEHSLIERLLNPIT